MSNYICPDCGQPVIDISHKDCYCKVCYKKEIEKQTDKKIKDYKKLMERLKKEKRNENK